MALDTELPPEPDLSNGDSPPAPERDYSALASQLGVDISGDTPPPADSPAMPGETPKAEAPVPAAEPPHKEHVRKRLAEKEWKQKYEELYAEHEPLKSKLPELENQLVETRTLAEQRAARAKELEEAWKNEADAFSPDLVYELPEVKAAQANFEVATQALFPVDISNPDADEPDLRFEPASLTPEKSNVVRSMLDHWEKAEFNSGINAARRAEIQHVALSNIASQLGVPAANFDLKEIDGVEYPVLSTRHPVYKHLKSSVRPFIAARQQVGSAQAAAIENKRESFSSVVQSRAETTRKLFKDTGVGVTGDTLKAALAKSPQNQNLKVMELVESHPELLQELNANMEAEAALNGHYRPQLDLVESDLESRNKTAQAHLQRIGQRAVNAPLAPVLKSLVLKQHSEIADLKKKLAELEEEASRTRMQAEPGAVGSGDGVGDPVRQDSEFGIYGKYAHLLKQ